MKITLNTVRGVLKPEKALQNLTLKHEMDIIKLLPPQTPRALRILLSISEISINIEGFESFDGIRFLRNDECI